MPSLVIDGAAIATVDPAATEYRSGYVVVVDGVITGRILGDHVRTIDLHVAPFRSSKAGWAVRPRTRPSAPGEGSLACTANHLSTTRGSSRQRS